MWCCVICTGTTGSPGTNSKPVVGSVRPGVDPLPDEWEELVDQETKHRFFANHLTRQTSWTDPRDRLITYESHLICIIMLTITCDSCVIMCCPTCCDDPWYHVNDAI